MIKSNGQQLTLYPVAMHWSKCWLFPPDLSASSLSALWAILKGRKWGLVMKTGHVVCGSKALGSRCLILASLSYPIRGYSSAVDTDSGS